MGGGPSPQFVRHGAAARSVWLPRVQLKLDREGCSALTAMGVPGPSHMELAAAAVCWLSRLGSCRMVASLRTEASYHGPIGETGEAVAWRCTRKYWNWARLRR